MRIVYRLGCFCCLALFAIGSPAQDDFSIEKLREMALEALNAGDNRGAVENADAMVRVAPNNPRVTLAAADIYLRAGECEFATRLFDRYLKTNKNDLPELWQRGIALYFVGKYDEAARQFEVHRTANPNDVENAAWHFLCVAKAESPSEAKAKLLPAPGDPRPPLEEVLKMLDTGDPKPVIEKVESFEEGTDQRASAEFYGDFYLGLYADAVGRPGEAKMYMNRSAKDAPRNYMGDVARVYAKHLNEKK